MQRRPLLILLLCGALAGCASGSASTRPATTAPTTPTTGTTQAAPSGPPTFENGSFASGAVHGTLHYEVALPPGYTTLGKRYPVVYFLHGLPAGPTSYDHIGGYAHSLAATKHPAILVGAQGARSGDTDPEWHDWGLGRNWETATESELVQWIDRHYRTIPRRSARAIIGVSAGGYGATLIAIHHPETYRVIESWSGYFILTTPEGEPAKLESAEDEAYANAHTHVPHLKQDFAPYGRTFFGFYTGTKDPYPGFVADNEKFADELTAAGIPHVFKLYDGAHNQDFWNDHQDDWLGRAVDRLDTPR